MHKNLSRPPSSLKKSADHSDFNKPLNLTGSWCSDTGRPQSPLSARARMGSDSNRATPVPRPHSAMGAPRGSESGGGGVKVRPNKHIPCAQTAAVQARLHAHAPYTHAPLSVQRSLCPAMLLSLHRSCVAICGFDRKSRSFLTPLYFRSLSVRVPPINLNSKKVRFLRTVTLEYLLLPRQQQGLFQSCDGYNLSH